MVYWKSTQKLNQRISIISNYLLYLRSGRERGSWSRRSSVKMPTHWKQEKFEWKVEASSKWKREKRSCSQSLRTQLLLQSWQKPRLTKTRVPPVFISNLGELSPGSSLVSDFFQFCVITNYYNNNNYKLL